MQGLLYIHCSVSVMLRSQTTMRQGGGSPSRIILSILSSRLNLGMQKITIAKVITGLMFIFRFGFFKKAVLGYNLVSLMACLKVRTLSRKDTNFGQQVLRMHVVLPLTKRHLCNKDRIFW